MDERCGLPSASGAEIFLACPGSFQKQRALALLSVDNEFMASGRKIHDALYKDDPAGLAEDQRVTFNNCKKILSDILEKVMPEGSVKYQKEQRYWLRDPETDEKLGSSRVDLLAISGTTVVIVDWKSGWLEEEESEKNMQLMMSAACVRDQLGDKFEKYILAVIQPKTTKGAVCAEFTSKQIEESMEQIVKTLKVCVQPLAPVIPGDWCAYCNARGVCGQAFKYVLDKRMEEGVIERLTPQQIGRLVPSLGAIKKICEKIEENAKKLLEADPASVPGCYLKPNSPMSKVIEVEKVYEAFKDMGTEKDFIQFCCSTSKASLTKYVELHNPGMTSAEAERQAEVRLKKAGCLEYIKKSPTLKWK